MTQDEIIRSPIGREQLVALAREAGLIRQRGNLDIVTHSITQIERFAALVAAHEREKHVDLTNDEIANLFKSAYPQSSIMDCDISLGKRIIAAFKEKNK